MIRVSSTSKIRCMAVPLRPNYRICHDRRQARLQVDLLMQGNGNGAWERSDSNREPRDYESPALTVELRSRFRNLLANSPKSLPMRHLRHPCFYMELHANLCASLELRS